MDDRPGVEIDDFNAGQDGAQPPRLTGQEVDDVRDLLTNLPRWENVLRVLQRDQTVLTESVANFATRVETRQHESSEQASRTQQLLEQVIEQMQQYSSQSSATMMDHTEKFRTMHAEIQQMRAEVHKQQVEVAELRSTVTNISGVEANAGEDVELYPEWDVVGTMPANTPVYNDDELESRITKSFKQKETPIFGGENNEDIDVYVRNMIMWHGAFGLFFKQPQVDARVGKLMMSHTKGKAKVWLLQEYSGEWRWSCIAKKMRQRFLTKSREEDQVARLFDCTQDSRALDTYIEEFVRLSRTSEVSVKFKMILFKKGLQSQELRNFLQTKQHTMLEGLVDAARAMNPRKSTAEPGNKKNSNSKGTGDPNMGKNRKSAPNNNVDKKTEVTRCTPTSCTEQGHSRDKCWQMHPEMQPKWLKKKNNASSSTTEASHSSTERLLEMVASLQADFATFKSDLN